VEVDDVDVGGNRWHVMRGGVDAERWTILGV
jgi:hypothetical protein